MSETSKRSDFFENTPFAPQTKPAGVADVKTIFDPTSEWEQARLEVSHHERFYPNSLAYNESSGTMALIVTRSFSGDDFALSEAALLFLEAALEKASEKTTKPSSLHGSF